MDDQFEKSDLPTVAAIISLAARNWRLAVVLAAMAFINQVAMQIFGVANAKSWGLSGWISLGAWYSLFTVVGAYVGMGYFACLIETFQGRQPSFAVFHSGGKRYFVRGCVGMVATIALLLPATALPIALAIMAPVLPKEFAAGLAVVGVVGGVSLFGMGIWLSMRLNVWLPSMFHLDCGMIDAMKHSFNLTNGHLFRIFVWIFLPLLVANLLSRITGYFIVQLTGEILKFMVLPVLIPPTTLLIYHELMRRRGEGHLTSARADGANDKEGAR